MPLAILLGKLLGWNLRYVFRYRRQQIKKNLDLAFGINKWDRDLERKIYQHFGLLIVELLSYPKKSIEQASKETTVHDYAVLEEALRLGKGAIIVTGHFGHWEQAIASVANVGHEVGVVVKSLRGVDNEFMFKEIRGNKNVVSILKDKAAVEIFRMLKRGGVVCMVIDQHAKSTESTKVNFFGEECSTYAAPALFAARSGAPIIPGIAWRDEDLRSYHIKFLEALMIEKDEKTAEDIQSNTQKMLDAIELELRKKPEDWIWMHDRWKKERKKRKK
jgi:Kdo2-lipid IVA lauroyltransferase/acyltransferase